MVGTVEAVFPWDDRVWREMKESKHREGGKAAKLKGKEMSSRPSQWPKKQTIGCVAHSQSIGPVPAGEGEGSTFDGRRHGWAQRLAPAACPVRQR